MPHLELISFKLCPFVQRSVITLMYKNVDFDITYIDLEKPPAWFLSISPFGRVPALRVENSDVLFESAIINEYIDEITPPMLMPTDPLIKAKARSWIQFGEACLFDQYHLMACESDTEWDTLVDKIQSQFVKLEAVIDPDGPGFFKEQFSLVDAAFAPLFMRYALLNEPDKILSPKDFPRLYRWSTWTLNQSAVKKSVVDDFQELYRAYLMKKGGYIAQNPGLLSSNPLW